MLDQSERAEVGGDSQKLDLLLETLRHETVDLIEQGDTLTSQMHKLYKGVHHLVSDHILDTTDRDHSETSSLADETYMHQDTGISLAGASHHGEMTAMDKSNTFPQSNKHQVYIQKQLKMLQNPLCGGSRFQAVLSNTAYDHLDQSNLNFVQHSQPTEFRNDKNSQYLPYYKPGVVSQINSNGDETCLQTEEESPVTVSSGYSSDKDLNHSDILQQLHDSVEDDSLLLNCPSKESFTLHGQSMDDSVSSCDQEVALIHDKHQSEENDDEQEADPKKFVIEADQLYQQNCQLCSSQTALSSLQTSFRPIVAESNIWSNSTQQPEPKSIQNHQHHCQSLKVVNKSKKRADSFSVVRQTMKDIVKDLKQHSGQVTRSQSLLVRHSDGGHSNSKGKHSNTPPITSLPGFHPAWCAKQRHRSLSSDSTFTISHNSAFRPYSSGSSTSQDLTGGNTPGQEYFSAGDSPYNEESRTRLNSGHNAEPLYASLKRNSLKSYKCSSGFNSLSTDSGRGSSDVCNISQCLCDQSLLRSSTNRLSYECIKKEPIYEHIIGNNAQSTSVHACPSSHPPEIPPKLPARNPSSKYRASNAQQTVHCTNTATNCMNRRTQRRRTVKLEDIVKPNDIIHSSGKHMYTVSDILQSVDKINQDIPTQQCEKSSAPSRHVKHDSTAKLRRCQSYVSVKNPASIGHRFTSCDDISSGRELRKLKKLVSPIRATKNDCNMALTKKLYPVKDGQGQGEMSCNNVVGFIVIPTQYGLQFKASSSDNCGNQSGVTQAMARLTIDSEAQQHINWVTRSAGREIFC